MTYLWYTEHDINHRVLNAVAAGLARAGAAAQAMQSEGAQSIAEGEHICYGVLRGSDAILKTAHRMGWPWYHIDNGYFRPGHFNGYYRISKGNTQACFNAAQASDGQRWRELGLEIGPWQRNHLGHILVCPPTAAMGTFFGFDPKAWLSHVLATLSGCSARPVVVRHKHSSRPLEEEMQGAYAVVTFNSGVAWQALLQGIPAIADRQCSVRTWNQFDFADIEKDLTQCDRQALFHCLANNQFTLQEFAERPDLWITALRSQGTWPFIFEASDASVSATATPQAHSGG